MKVYTKKRTEALFKNHLILGIFTGAKEEYDKANRTLIFFFYYLLGMAMAAFFESSLKSKRALSALRNIVTSYIILAVILLLLAKFVFPLLVLRNLYKKKVTYTFYLIFFVTLCFTTYYLTVEKEHLNFIPITCIPLVQSFLFEIACLVINFLFGNILFSPSHDAHLEEHAPLVSRDLFSTSYSTMLKVEEV